MDGSPSSFADTVTQRASSPLPELVGGLTEGDGVDIHTDLREVPEAFERFCRHVVETKTGEAIEWDRLANATYSPEQARELIRAAEGRQDLVAIHPLGTVAGDLIVAIGNRHSVVFDGKVLGSVLHRSREGAGFTLGPNGFVEGNIVVKHHSKVGHLDVRGVVRGDVQVSPLSTVQSISVSGHVGNVTVRGEVEDSVALDPDGTASGTVSIHRRVGRDLQVGGDVEGDVVLGSKGAIDGALLIGGTVGGELQISGRIAEKLTVLGDINGGVLIFGDVGGPVSLHGSFGKVTLKTEVMGDLSIIGEIVGDLSVYGEVQGDATFGHMNLDAAYMGGDIAGRLDWAVASRHATFIGGSIGGPLLFAGGAAEGLHLTGHLGGGAVVTPESTELLHLRSVRGARFDRPVHIGANVSLASCDFRQCGDLDELDLVGADLFAGANRRRVKRLDNPPAGVTEEVPAGEMASIYRQLRVNLEGKGNRPASAFFYRGEMDSRRRAARQRGGWAGWSEWAWISLYRWVAGYGLRVAPPLLWFVAAWIVGTLVFLARGLVVLHGGEYVSASWWQAASFTLQSMLSVFRPPDALLGLGTTVVQVALRIVGPLLLGLAAFAVRDKVAR